MIDPETARFWVSWQTETGPLEDDEVVGAEAAIAWGRQRADAVLIRLGHTSGTYFSAGAVPAEDPERPIPLWPPAEAPAKGWWTPPSVPTLVEVEEVAAEVDDGSRAAVDAANWASDRMRVALEQGAPEEIREALLAIIGRGPSGLRRV